MLLKLLQCGFWSQALLHDTPVSAFLQAQCLDLEHLLASQVQSCARRLSQHGYMEERSLLYELLQRIVHFLEGGEGGIAAESAAGELVQVGAW